MSIAAVVPLIAEIPERLASVSDLLLALARQFPRDADDPGIIAHLLPRVRRAPNKPDADLDLSAALLAVSADWVVFVEDDMEIGRGFGDSARDSIRLMSADATIGAVALFSRREQDPQHLAAGERFHEYHEHFKQGQALVMPRAVARLWAERLAGYMPCPDWDIVFGQACAAASLRILTALPSTAQHRCLPSSLGHRCDVRSLTFVG